jgi:hypothetical protein
MITVALKTRVLRVQRQKEGSSAARVAARE